VFSGLLLVTAGTQNVFAEQPPPQITYKGLKNGCKVFEIKDFDKNGPLITSGPDAGKREGLISMVTVSSNFFGNVDVDSATVDPATPNMVGDFGDVGGKSLVYVDNKPHTVTLKVCPKVQGQVQFEVSAKDEDGLKSSTVFVTEVKANAPDGIGNGVVFNFPNAVILKKLDCAKLMKVGEIEKITESENVKDIKVKSCREGIPGTTVVELEGSLEDASKPGIVTYAGDPVGDFFLSVVEICIAPEVGPAICPTDFDTSIDLFLILIVGGEIIPIEQASLLLAGTQSFSWMIPVILSGIGIGLFAVSRKSE